MYCTCSLSNFVLIDIVQLMTLAVQYFILLVDHITSDFDAFNFQPFIDRQLYLKLSLNTLITTRWTNQPLIDCLIGNSARLLPPIQLLER